MYPCNYHVYVREKSLIKISLPVLEVYMRARYVNLSIPEELAKEIDEFLKKSKGGYRSRAEFLSEAIRLRLGILGKSK